MNKLETNLTLIMYIFIKYFLLTLPFHLKVREGLGKYILFSKAYKWYK